MRITGIALAILPVATVENLEILRRVVIVSVKVWLLRRWRPAQGFWRIAEPQRREEAMNRVGRVIVGEAIALFTLTAFFFWQAATSSSLISYKDPVGDRLSWIFLAVLALGG